MTNTSKVKSIKKLTEQKRVINLNVFKNHTFVTGNGIVTHNCDGTSKNFQDSLRNIIEDCMENARFIMTGNYPHKITDALYSRAPHFHIDALDKDQYTYRVAEILAKEGISFDIDTLTYYVDKNYPDMRKVFNDIERFTFDGKLEIIESKSQVNQPEWMVQSIEMFKKQQYREARDLICKNIQYDEYEEFYRLMYENIDWWAEGDNNKRDKALMVIKDHLVADANVGDREIVLSSCLTHLSML